ncbi:putative disease resistance RPP13-like protein 1 [Mangifera indica]|uniref:putative disease resistance RPP13-like protein 1 n=1 Tax=Mangifera indica TaxID=29780 RepID=UPI001CFA13BE|nr:putative disease resistance RPP13-like protein 1 [Mangifera indica]
MSIILEAFLSAAFDMLFEKLAASTELLRFPQQEQIQEDLKKWEMTLRMMEAVLEDAEERQGKNEKVKIWLGKLQNLAYDVEDTLDELLYESHHQHEPSTWELLIPCCFNPQTVEFNSMMMSQVENISTRFDEIASKKEQLGLIEFSGGRSNSVIQRPPTTSLVTEAYVYGRKEDQEAMVELLLKNDLSAGNRTFSVIPTVGMGGIGKTTLAQLAYNDPKLEGHFDFKAWVCVSEKFNVTEITKTILVSIGGHIGDVNDLNNLQERLKEKLSKKRFLFVLDDIWTGNPSDWSLLRRPFESGLPESKIIITTRNEVISTRLGTLPAYPLKGLSDEACLSIFTRCALGTTDFSQHEDLKEIGEKIVKKCNGLPLAAETLGGLLHGKPNREDWGRLLNRRVWELPEKDSNIIPALKVSYYFLPSRLKRCFAYCSIFPKAYEFLKEETILLWMAEGLLHNNEKQMEDLGNEFFDDLKSRSFFKQSSRDMSRFVMHDLINDLAQWAAGEICFRIDNKLDGNINFNVSRTNLRYLSYISDQFDGVKRFEGLCEAKCLRAFLPLELPHMTSGYLAYDVLHMVLELPRLRALSLRMYKISELPNSIGELKHLRYLNLSGTLIEILPNSINTLYNLQTLLVEDCDHLKKLCEDMGNLTNLHHLNNSGTPALEEMPLRIGNLTGLLTLPNFVVGKSSGSRLEELKNLTHIRERLCISGLENVNATIATNADLISKRDLNVIVLKWTSSNGDPGDAGEEKVLDMLRPHQGLKELIISGYGGGSFPVWLEDPSFSNLAKLTFENCNNCEMLPSFGELPFLKHLVIKGMAKIQKVEKGFYGYSEVPFPLLETLCFKYMEGWEVWTPNEEEEAKAFPYLRELSIIWCSKLEVLLPKYLPSLEKLVITGCKKLVVSVESLPKLCKLSISSCKQMEWGSTIDLSSLKSVHLGDISTPICPTERFTYGLSKVEEMTISRSGKLTSLWQSTAEWLQDNSSLCRLEIRQCPQLLCLVAEEEQEEGQEQLGMPCRLEYLELYLCERFEKLPKSLCSLSFLKEISINCCPKLVSFPETSMPPQLRIIKIRECNALKSLPEAWVNNSSTYLERLSIKECESLTYITKFRLPLNLKRLDIESCNNLGTLINEENTDSGTHSNTSLLEFLEVHYCRSLTSLWSGSELPHTLERIELWSCDSLASLSSGGNLPMALKSLVVFECTKLESIAERLQNLTSLEHIEISSGYNLTCFPPDLHKLRNLQKMFISGFPNLVSFPEEGLPLRNLRLLYIVSCKKLKALPNRIHKLTALKQLIIRDCPSMAMFPVDGFPISLESLEIQDLNIFKPLFDWGLNRLTSLKSLNIGKVSPEVSFPQEETGMMLPTSLTHLIIQNFPNLERLSSDIQNLTCLERLCLLHCPKLKFLPEDWLSSLLQLEIYDCPLLKQMWEKHGGINYWPMIARIPYVKIDSCLMKYRTHGQD